jgi:hypothetical protein
VSAHQFARIGLNDSLHHRVHLGAGLGEAHVRFETRHDFKEVVAAIAQQLGGQRERNPDIGRFAEEESVEHARHSRKDKPGGMMPMTR